MFRLKRTPIPPDATSVVASLMEEREDLAEYSEEVTLVLDDTRWGIKRALKKMKKHCKNEGALEGEEIERFFIDIMEESIPRISKPQFLLDREARREAKRVKHVAKCEKRIDKHRERLVRKQRKRENLEKGLRRCRECDTWRNEEEFDDEKYDNAWCIGCNSI